MEVAAARSVALPGVLSVERIEIASCICRAREVAGKSVVEACAIGVAGKAPEKRVPAGRIESSRTATEECVVISGSGRFPGLVAVAGHVHRVCDSQRGRSDWKARDVDGEPAQARAPTLRYPGGPLSRRRLS